MKSQYSDSSPRWAVGGIMLAPRISTSSKGSTASDATEAGIEEEQGGSEETPHPDSKGRIERWADWTTGLRKLVLNLLLLIFAAFILTAFFLAFLHAPSVVVVGNMDVGELDGTEHIKSEDLHARMTEAFRDAYRLGGDAMPEEVVTNSITDEANQFDFEIPEVGLSFNKVVKFLRKALNIDGDATVTGRLAYTALGGYSLHAELTDYNGIVGFDGKDTDLEALLFKAASELLRNRNPYVYASGLSVKDRLVCYADSRNCEFAYATVAYQAIEEAEDIAPYLHRNVIDLIRPLWQRHYREWALLAVSKIREDQRDYVGELQLARSTTVRWSRFSWGYYNWGVALTELGCYAGAIQAFSQTISIHPAYAAAYNARGRIHLMLAEALLRSGNNDPTDEVGRAIADFRMAVSLNGDYAEAHINLGKAYRLNPTEYPNARVEFKAFSEAPNSSQAARAYQQLAILERLQGDDAKYLDDMGSARRAMATNTVCGFEFSRSLREASGCMEPPERDRLPDLSSSPDCGRYSEGLRSTDSDDEPLIEFM